MAAGIDPYTGVFVFVSVSLSLYVFVCVCVCVYINVYVYAYAYPFVFVVVFVFVIGDLVLAFVFLIVPCLFPIGRCPFVLWFLSSSSSFCFVIVLFV